MESELDSDGYPRDEDLERIRKWPLVGDYDQHLAALLDFIGARWSYPERWERVEGHDECMDRPVWRYCCSTGGWSGNESLIGALQDNWIAWSLCWSLSKRGGYYEFEVKRDTGAAREGEE